MLKCQQLLDFDIYQQDKIHAQMLSMKKSFIMPEPGLSAPHFHATSLLISTCMLPCMLLLEHDMIFHRLSMFYKGTL